MSSPIPSAPRSLDEQEVTRWAHFVTEMLNGRWRTAFKASTFSCKPGASNIPSENGEITLELTSDNTVTIRAKGSDGTVRSGTVTLS